MHDRNEYWRNKEKTWGGGSNIIVFIIKNLGGKAYTLKMTLQTQCHLRLTKTT